MSKYKRLTIKGADWFVDVQCDDEKIYERLVELEDKIEDGTFIELPRIIHPNGLEWFVQYQYETGAIDAKVFYTKKQAENFLEEVEE